MEFNKKTKKEAIPKIYQSFNDLQKHYGLQHKAKSNTKSGGYFTLYENFSPNFCKFLWRNDNKDTIKFECRKCLSKLFVRRSENELTKWILIRLNEKNCARLLHEEENNEDNRIVTGGMMNEVVRNSLVDEVSVDLLSFYPQVIDMEGICAQLYLRVFPLKYVKQMCDVVLYFRNEKENRIIKQFNRIEWGEGIGKDHLIIGANVRLLFLIPFNFLEGTLQCSLKYDIKNVSKNQYCFKKNCLQITSSTNIKSKKRKIDGDSLMKNEDIIRFIGEEKIYGIEENSGPIIGGQLCSIFFSLQLRDLYLSHIQDSFLVNLGVRRADVLSIMKSEKMKNLEAYKKEYSNSCLVALICTPSYRYADTVDVVVEFSGLGLNKSLWLKKGYRYYEREIESNSSNSVHIGSRGNETELSEDDLLFLEEDDVNYYNINNEDDNELLFDIDNLNMFMRRDCLGWNEIFRTVAKNEVKKVEEIQKRSRKLCFNETDNFGNGIIKIARILGNIEMVKLLEGLKSKIERKKLEIGELNETSRLNLSENEKEIPPQPVSTNEFELLVKRDFRSIDSKVSVLELEGSADKESLGSLERDFYKINSKYVLRCKEVWGKNVINWYTSEKNRFLIFYVDPKSVANLRTLSGVLKRERGKTNNPTFYFPKLMNNRVLYPRKAKEEMKLNELNWIEHQVGSETEFVADLFYSYNLDQVCPHTKFFVKLLNGKKYRVSVNSLCGELVNPIVKDIALQLEMKDYYTIVHYCLASKKNQWKRFSRDNPAPRDSFINGGWGCGESFVALYEI